MYTRPVFDWKPRCCLAPEQRPEFEFIVWRELERALNASSRYSLFENHWIPYGTRPEESRGANRSVVTILAHREVHLIFGDFSHLHPRVA